MTKSTTNKDQPRGERRIGLKAVPDNINARLTELQRLGLSRLESFGYSIKFVRRTHGEDELVVLADPTGKRYAILDQDGNLDTTTSIAVR